MSIRHSLFLFICFISPLYLSGQSDRNYWSEVRNDEVRAYPRYQWPEKFRAISIDENLVRNQLIGCPSEQFPYIAGYGSQLSVPMPDGSAKRFRVFEVPIMDDALARKFPQLKCYGGYAEDDPYTAIRISLTELGFQAMIMSPGQAVFIDPVSTFPNVGFYVVYEKSDLASYRTFDCSTSDSYKLHGSSAGDRDITSAMRSTGSQLRTYRAAVACTGEYSAFYGGTVSGALSGIVASMNRVNFVYETEVSVRMVLVANNNLIVYLNAATDPYTNNSGSTMLGQNQSNLDAVIGSANYDIGHVFSTGGGGVATLNSPCNASNKARGVTGQGSPVGDPFDIDYVAHEIGHQFGAQHTFNGTTSSCSGNRSSSSAFEPGSGITIMGYAGICGAENLAPNSIPYFHTHSYDQISNFITNLGGNTCPVITSTGNNPPVISLGSPLTYTIPYLTPFQLTGSATDPNGHALTYSWEQFDLGTASPPVSPNGPIFRPFSPTTSPTRVFPKLSDILSNTQTYGEWLPSAARNLRFRLTVRDNQTGGGGVSNGVDTMKITVVNTGSAFSVTSPNTAVSWVAGSTQTVTWDVSQTDIAPISCSNVRILLSTDGGLSFPTVVLANTPNDGTQNITVPATPTSSARIKVEAVGNIFFDICNSNFSILPSSATLTSISTIFTTSSLCAGAATTVDFVGDGPANGGNTFTAQLSNSSGSFASPLSIGTLNSTAASGTISCTIPGGVGSGSAYRVRVISSSPAVTGSANSSNITISGALGSAGVIAGLATVASGQTNVNYSIPAVLNATNYVWTVPAGAAIVSGDGTNSISVNFSNPATPGSITVTPSNLCFTGTLASKSIQVVTLNGPATVCEGSTGNSYTISTVPGAISYMWTLSSGAVITAGNNTPSITVSFPTGATSGNITIATNDGSGNGIFASMEVAVLPQATAVVLPLGPISSCNSALLSFTPQSGITYQWYRNGIIIPGETSSSHTATVSGNYSVESKLYEAQTFTATPSASIPDNLCTGVISEITVAGYSANVPSSSIYVNVNITHTWVGDLVIFLEGPGGQILGLSNRTGNTNNSGDNFVNTVFADSGNVPLPTSGAPYTGLYKPVQTVFTSCLTSNVTSFAAFGAGAVNPNGSWKLHVYDRAGQDLGTLNNWSITFPAAALGCTSFSNTLNVSILSTPVVNTISPLSGSAGTSVTISGTGLTGTSNVTFDGSPASGFTVVADNQVTATVPAGATSGTVQILHPCGNVNAGTFTVSGSNAVLSLRVFLQGFYTGASTMISVLGGSLTDTVTVELHSAIAPYALIHTSAAVVNTSGFGNFTFPGSVNGNSYYIVVRHRNSLQTWSKFPVAFGSNTSYDFTF